MTSNRLSGNINSSADATDTIIPSAPNLSADSGKPSALHEVGSVEATATSNKALSFSSPHHVSRSSSFNVPVADVETTNWNAVAMLASQYGINLRRSGEMSRPRPSDLEGDQEEEDSMDLGIGTPFRITAKKEGGKTIYRFKSRGPAPVSSPAAASASSSNRPRKAGAIGQASPAFRTPDSASQKSLKGSRSIPALRASGLLRGAALSNAGMSSSPSSSNSPDSSNYAARSLSSQQAARAADDGLEASLGSGLSPSAPDVGDSGILAILGIETRNGSSSKSRNASSPRDADSSASTSGAERAVGTGKTFSYGMPLQDGDVLGAILGLNDLVGGGSFRQEEEGLSSPKASEQKVGSSPLIPEEVANEIEPERISSPSSEVRSASSSPTRERRGLRRTVKGGLPHASPSAAFSALSNSSSAEIPSRAEAGIGLGLSHSVDDPPTITASLSTSNIPSSAFGSSFGLTASQKFDAASAGDKLKIQAPSTTSGWNQSPIPQMQHLGQPLFDDLEAHASSFGLSSAESGPSIAGIDASREENLRRLREAQSWESSGTARGKESSLYNQLKWSEYPQSLVPHLQINFRRDAPYNQLRESDEERSDPETSNKAQTSKSSCHLDMNLYSAEAFIFDVIQHYTQHGALAAARSQGISVTKSITFADSGTSKTPELSSNPNVHSQPGSGSHSRPGSSRRGSIAAALSPVRASATSNTSSVTSDVNSPTSSIPAPSDNSSSAGVSSQASQAQDTSASAAPGDDPRFSLWAVRAYDAAGTLVLAGRDGVVAKFGSHPIAKGSSSSNASEASSSREHGSGGQAYGKRWSIKGNGIDTTAPGQDKAFKASNASLSADNENVKELVLFPRGRSSLIAASCIRLIAELTSEIDHRLLTDFFYTYRPFLAPSSLLRLLILRFHWALSTPQGPHDEARRRIVIVRTYVVIKYWLLHFFEVDFLPDSALRKQLTGWLNSLTKDKNFSIRPADMSIIKSLKKVVRNLKETYSLMGVGGLLANDDGKSPAPPNFGQLSRSSADQSHPASPRTDVSHVSNHSEDSHPSSSELRAPKASEDVDLEFTGSSSDVQRSVTASRTGNAGQRGSLGNTGTIGENSSSAAKQAIFPNTAPAPGESILGSSQGGNSAISNRRANQYGSTSVSIQAPPPPLPHSHNAISRVFVNTVGRLARFKRVLGTARASPFPFPNGPDAGLEDLEFEANDSGDLLFIRGGLENFINSFNLPPMAISGGMSPALARAGFESEEQETDESTDPENGISDGTTQDETPSLSTTSAKSRSTPASSLDLSSDSARVRAGLGIDAAMDMEAGQPFVDDHVHRSRRSRSGDDGVDGDAEDELDLSPSPKHNLDAANLLFLQRMTEWESKKTVCDHLHHTTSEQTLRSTSTVEPKRASPNSPSKNVAASIRSQRSSEHPQFTKSGSRASLHSRKLASRLAFAPGADLSRSNSRVSTTSAGQPRIVQIDDIDLSSDEDDGVVRRALRRLPGARDLRMANHVHDLEPSRQSFDSLSNSSLGRVHAAHASISGFSLASYAPSMVSLSGAAALQAPPSFGTVQTEMLDPDEALEGYELVRGFRLDGMDSDEDEPGDVEAALMRLEGVIDEEKQREKARRVERMWQDSQIRKAEDDERRKSRLQTRSSLRDSRISRSEGGDGLDEDEGAAADEDLVTSRTPSYFLSRQPSAISHRTMQDVDEDSDSESVSPRLVRTSRTNYDQQRSPPPSTISLSPEGASAGLSKSGAAGPGTTRPLAPRASSAGTARSHRPVSHAGIVYGSPSAAAAPGGAGSWAQAQAAQQARAMDRAIASSKFGLWTLPPVHRSFLLGYRSEVIAQQLCLIEAELFKAVTWEELASDRWKERSASGASEVNGWESFYQARVRERAEDKTGAYKEKAVEAIIARFNLTCNWVVSEIVLTQNVEERAAVIAKLIRVAWKCYHQSNFASLTQIILGLRSPWVERLRKTWARIGMWEMRILRDLKNFTSPLRNFSLLRNALQGMIAQSGMEDLVTSAGPPQGSQAFQNHQTGTSQSQRNTNAQGRGVHVSDGCIPFFGLFISDLAVNDALPSFIDPSCPSSISSIDSNDALAGLSKPDAFDHLQPLPPGVKLEPLINLYKFRVTAMTIKTVLAFQERAKAYKYEADGGVYVKCLKIRCLSGEQMTQISHHAEP